MTKYEEKTDYVPGDRSTARKKCSCSDAFQDKMYGAGVRVHNRKMRTATNPTLWRCTVCGTNR